MELNKVGMIDGYTSSIRSTKKPSSSIATRPSLQTGFENRPFIGRRVVTGPFGPVDLRPQDPKIIMTNPKPSIDFLRSGKELESKTSSQKATKEKDQKATKEKGQTVAKESIERWIPQDQKLKMAPYIERRTEKEIKLSQKAIKEKFQKLEKEKGQTVAKEPLEKKGGRSFRDYTSIISEIKDIPLESSMHTFN